MRDFLATPFFLLVNIFGYAAAFISGKQIALLVIEYEEDDEDETLY